MIFNHISIDYDNSKQQLWIHREGHGLIFYASYSIKASLTTAATTFDGDPAVAVKLGEWSTSQSGASGAGFNTGSRAQGYYDEVRLYNSI